MRLCRGEWNSNDVWESIFSDRLDRSAFMNPPATFKTAYANVEVTSEQLHAVDVRALLQRLCRCLSENQVKILPALFLNQWLVT